jgi:hypothetical protein
MISIARPGGVPRMARSTLSASSMSMCRRSGIPSREIVSWRWIKVMTVASRREAIVASARRRDSASSCRWMTGCSELRMKKIQIASQGTVSAVVPPEARTVV